MLKNRIFERLHKIKNAKIWDLEQRFNNKTNLSL